MYVIGTLHTVCIVAVQVVRYFHPDLLSSTCTACTVLSEYSNTGVLRVRDAQQ